MKLLLQSSHHLVLPSPWSQLTSPFYWYTLYHRTQSSPGRKTLLKAPVPSPGLSHLLPLLLTPRCPNLGPRLSTDSQPFSCSWSPGLLTCVELDFLCLWSGLWTLDSALWSLPQPYNIDSVVYWLIPLVVILVCLQLHFLEFLCPYSIHLSGLLSPLASSWTSWCLLVSWTTTCCLLTVLQLSDTT